MRLPDWLQSRFCILSLYNAIEDFEKENTILEKLVKKPVVIQEFGVPSYNGI
jgi:hypothetical protein